MTDALLVTSAWPIAVLACPAQFDAAWVTDLDRKVARLFARGEPFAFITDTSNVKAVPGAVERRLLADWAARPEQVAQQKRWNVGSATIVRSTVMRGALQALYWFWTPPCPQHAARDFDDAWSWSLTMLAKRSIALPRPAAELRALALRELEAGQAGGASSALPPR
jgi:hypothetical protein